MHTYRSKLIKLLTTQNMKSKWFCAELINKYNLFGYFSVGIDLKQRFWLNLYLKDTEEYKYICMYE